MYDAGVAGHCFTRIPHAFWRVAPEKMGLRGQQLLVLAVLLDRMDADHKVARTYPQIVRETGQGRRAVMDAIEDLEERGLIDREKVDGTYEYTLTPFLDALHDVVSKSHVGTRAKSHVGTTEIPRWDALKAGKEKTTAETPGVDVKAEGQTRDQPSFRPSVVEFMNRRLAEAGDPSALTDSDVTWVLRFAGDAYRKAHGFHPTNEQIATAREYICEWLSKHADPAWSRGS
jgi:hypothetical protein